jgi:hypothetical protein
VAPPGNQAANGEDEAQPEHREKPAYSPTPDPNLVVIEVTDINITKSSQLSGETVMLPKRSNYRRKLIELADEISGDINVVEAVGKIDDEALINKVAKGDIEYTRRACTGLL